MKRGEWREREKWRGNEKGTMERERKGETMKKGEQRERDKWRDNEKGRERENGARERE